MNKYLLAAALTLGGCVSMGAEPAGTDFTWQSPSTFHYAAWYKSDLVDKSGDEHEPDRIRLLETHILKDGGCNNGYVVDETVVRKADFGLYRKHYYGHCLLVNS